MKDYSDSGLLGACLVIRNNNYGSMLQSYATQRMLSDYGFRYELLVYRKKYTPAYILKSLPRLLNSVVWQDKFNEQEKKNFLKKHPELLPAQKKRAEIYQQFRAAYFTAPIVTYHGYQELREKSRRYSAFLTGSDQLWSPSGLPTNFYNLMFTYDEAVRISFASSFGVKQIPWYQRSRTRRYLERIPFISCREESGRAIVKELTGRDVPVAADPTMLFTAAEWREMLPCNTAKPERYIFSYILGTNPEYRRQVEQLRKETGLPIVSIHQFVEADLDFGDVSVEDAGPAEFVDLIRNAEYVCTDSFHGSVFAILTHRKFVTFNRYSEGSAASKNTRIESLCSRLGLTDRRFTGDILENIFADIDYPAVDEKLAVIRRETRDYLENAFDSI